MKVDDKTLENEVMDALSKHSIWILLASLYDHVTSICSFAENVVK